MSWVFFVRVSHQPVEPSFQTPIPSPGRLHLHPISETHQFRPTLTYIDMHLRKSRRTCGGDDEDEDDGPPPDPDEPPPAQVPKKEKKPAGEAKEVQVAVRKMAESQGLHFTGGMTQIRRDMLTLIHAEEDEHWDDYEYCGGEVSRLGHSILHNLTDALIQTVEANEAFESVFSKSFEELECKTDITSLLKDVPVS